MYTVLLALHSLTRWLVLIALVISLVQAYRGWLRNKPYLQAHDRIRVATVTVVHLQFMIGLTLYFISPVIGYFLHHFKEAVHERSIRFFGMEHSTMMIIAVALITIGAAKAKRKEGDKEKFKTIAIWFTIALLIILSSIPWAFSPLTSRPYFRSF